MTFRPEFKYDNDMEDLIMISRGADRIDLVCHECGNQSTGVGLVGLMKLYRALLRSLDIPGNKFFERTESGIKVSTIIG